jgi:hypothetical protein
MKTAAGLLLMLSLAACGSSSRAVIYNHMAPKDREAADLAAAFNAGLLSPGEYAEQKAKLGLR